MEWYRNDVGETVEVSYFLNFTCSIYSHEMQLHVDNK